MSVIWNRGPQLRRAPGTDEKSDSASSVANSGSKKSNSAPFFEIEMSGSASASASGSASGSGSAIEFGSDGGLEDTVAEPSTSEFQRRVSPPALARPMTPLESAPSSDSYVALEVELPGHALAAGSIAIPSDKGASPDLMMVDEPLPEVLPGSAQLQDLFVSEVLNAAQSEEKKGDVGLSLQPENDATQITAETIAASDTAVAALDSRLTAVVSAEKDIFQEIKEPGQKKIIPNNPIDENNTETFLQSRALNQNIDLGQSPFVAEEAISSQLIQMGTTPIGKTFQSSPLGTTMNPHHDLSLRRRQKHGWFTGFVFITAFCVVAGLILSRPSADRFLQKIYEEIGLTSDNTQTDVIEPQKKKMDGDKSVAIKKQKKSAGAAGLSMAAKAKVKQAPAQVNDTLPEANEGEELKLEHILARPVSRYSETNRPLIPLIEISSALDEVQPRRVIKLMKNLPAGFSVRNELEKIALVELTARYYVQVGAYRKAMILFRKICTNPAKTSEVEVCLHAARSYALMGQFETARQVSAALSARLNGQDNQWQEWVKLVTLAANLEKPSIEQLIQVADELVDKGPFLTSEWSLQLATIFARSFMKQSAQVQLSFLRSLTAEKRKLIVTRMSTEKFGSDIGSNMFPGFLNLMLKHYELSPLNIESDESDADSELSYVGWIFRVISEARFNEPRESRARLAVLFAQREFSAMARLIEGQLAAQGGDYIAAQSMILEQLGPAIVQNTKSLDKFALQASTQQIIQSTQRLQFLPFLYVEWLFLGIKVSAGLNDRESMKTYLVALDDARRKFPELSNEMQYWLMLARGARVLGDVAEVERAVVQASRLANTLNESGLVGAERVWILMKKGQRSEAKALMKQLIREIPHHARLLELAAEFSASWGQDPSLYLKLEAEIPKKFETRGRDNVLLSFFTISKLLNNF
jgi:hypothetical protein